MIYCDSFERYGMELISLEYIIIGPLMRGGESGRRKSMYKSIHSLYTRLFMNAGATVILFWHRRDENEFPV